MTEANMNVDMGGGRQRRARVDYPSNSIKGKVNPNPEEPAERVKQEKIIEGEVKVRKQGVAGRFIHNFVTDDAPSVVNYVIMDVLLPAVKNMVSDAVSQGIERMLFGDARPSSRGGRPGYVNYANRSRSAAPLISDPRPPLSRQARTNHDFDDIIIGDRVQAEEVLDRLRELIDQYEVATVSDLYELVGLTGEFTDAKWGWYDLRTASVRLVRGGYLLSLPRTQAIV